MPDFGRPGFGGPGNGGPGSGEPSFDDIRRTDSFIDALADGQPIAPEDPADAQLAALLGGWRDEARWPPSTGLVNEEQAIAALSAGLAEKPEKPRNTDRRGKSGPPKHNRRGLSVIGTVAAASLFIGGFGAVVAGAGPGDALYGLRSMLFGESRQVRDDAVVLAARTELNQVQEMISRGDWQQAQEKLVAVSTQVASIGNQEQKQELLAEFNDLSAKVVERNPEATAAPGIVYTVPPEATELVPALAPPSSEPASTSETTSGAATTSTTADATDTTETTATTAETTATSATSATSATTATSATSTAPTTPTTSAPATTASSSSTPRTTSAPATTSAAQQSQAATTPTSAAPSTASSAVATTTAAPSPAEATQTSPAAQDAEEAEEAAAAEEATADETIADETTADQTTAEETTAARTAEETTAETTAEETTAEAETVQEEPVVTTSVAVPVS